jgi:hypothetical protein
MKESNPSSRANPAASVGPEAMGRLLELLEKRVGANSMDRIWIFPPLVKGRKEWGLVAVTCLTEDESQRSLITGRYTAELTGTGLVFDSEFSLEGLAPSGRFPRVMDGVTRRSDLQLGVPQEVEIHGEPDRFRDLLKLYESEEPVIPPQKP